MQKLVQGVHHFQRDLFSKQREFWRRLAQGQQPLALFITCSDSRVNPNLLTQTEPGELFILRNAGNIVPPFNGGNCGEAATIEYAVTALKITDIIICGHTGCGAVGALLNPNDLEHMPAMRQWLVHAEATRRIVTENYADLDPAARHVAAVEENVLVQLENLRTHPSVAAAVGRGSLHLHGWVYKIETGGVFSFHPEQGQFTPLEDMTSLPTYRLDPQRVAI
jgi:carbonic anhydrase